MLSNRMLLRPFMKHLAQFMLLLLLVSATSRTGEASDLLDCFLKAKEYDPQYRAVYHQYKAEQTLPKQSWAQLLPQVQGSYSSMNYDYTKAPELYQDYRGESLNITLRQPLFSATKLLDLKQNKARALSGELRLLDAKNTLMIKVAEAYFKHLHAIDTLKVLQEEEKATAENLRMVKLLSHAGEASLVDLHDAEARKAEVDFRAVDATNTAEITRQELERLVGEKIDSVASLSEDIAIARPSPENIQDWIEGVKEKNPIVKYYALTSDIAKDELRKQKAQRLPTLDLVGLYSDRNTNNDTETAKTRYYAGGFQISMPLWTSGYLSYRAQEFTERHAQATKEYERVLSDTIQNLRSSFLGVHASLAKVKSAQAYVTASQTALASTKMGYQSGVRTVVDLLNATSSLYKAKADLLQVRIDYFVEKLRLLYWNGRIDEDSLGEINGYLAG
jgi:outer membrane protein